MNKYFQLFILAFISVITFNSCEYQPEKEYFREVQRADSANLGITINPQQTSYVISAITSLRYSLQTGGYKLYKVTVFVDEKAIGYYTVASSYFKLDPKDYTAGLHQLTILITTNSATGSIADLIGMEGFIYSRSWDMTVIK